MITCCPKCGAKSDQEAETLCCPNDDDCPMACCDDWNEALDRLNAEQEQNSNPAIFIYQHLLKIVTGKWS
jgi:hypothetical protein